MDIQMSVVLKLDVSSWILRFFFFVGDSSLNIAGEDGDALCVVAFDNLRLYIEDH
jgi:hypothetical protein